MIWVSPESVCRAWTPRPHSSLRVHFHVPSGPLVSSVSGQSRPSGVTMTPNTRLTIFFFYPRNPVYASRVNKQRLHPIVTTNKMERLISGKNATGLLVVSVYVCVCVCVCGLSITGSP
jgi:hypothetical protein